MCHVEFPGGLHGAGPPDHTAAAGHPGAVSRHGYHFAETYAYRDRLTAELGLNLVNLVPRLSVAEQEGQFGILYQSAPDRCCGMRKVEPLFAGLEPYDVWFTALRRDQSPTRANLKVSDDFALPGGKHLTKVSPLADWTARTSWTYRRNTSIPLLSLYDRVSRASAASRAPRCRPIRTIRDRDAGRAGSSNVASTYSSRHSGA